jgi:hypothetical protein
MISVTPSRWDRGAPPRRSRASQRAVAWAVGTTLLIVFLFSVASQIFLPTLAADRLRSSLEAHGEGVHVSVSAFPAVELLFDRADRVTVAARRLLPSDHGNVSMLLERVSRADRLDASIGSIDADGLPLQDVSLHKRDRQVRASATVTMRAIEAALPHQMTVSRLTEGATGSSFTISVHAFGKSLRVTARLIARDGKLVIEPASPVLSFLHITVFADPQVRIESVSVRNAGDAFTFQTSGSYA